MKMEMCFLIKFYFLSFKKGSGILGITLSIFYNNRRERKLSFFVEKKYKKVYRAFVF